MSTRILVIGATGTVGSELVRRLVELGTSVVAATRDPASARAKGLPPSVEAVRFDFDDTTTWSPALEGVERLFLMARPGDDHADRCSIPLLDEAVERGIGHVTSLSAMGVEGMPDNALRKIEVHVEGLGVTWTFLRPNFFFQIFSMGPLLQGIRATGVIAVPAGDARLSLVDARDVAAVAARSLTNDELHGQALTLTGSQAVDHAQVATALSQVAGRDIRYEPLDEDTAADMLTRAAMPPARIERLLRFYRLVRQGACEPVSPEVERGLGRPATSLDRFARDYAEVWR